MLETSWTLSLKSKIEEKAKRMESRVLSENPTRYAGEEERLIDVLAGIRRCTLCRSPLHTNGMDEWVGRVLNLCVACWVREYERTN